MPNTSINDYSFDIRKIPGEKRIINGQLMQWTGQGWVPAQPIPTIEDPNTMTSSKVTGGLGAIAGKIGGSYLGKRGGAYIADKIFGGAAGAQTPTVLNASRVAGAASPLSSGASAAATAAAPYGVMVNPATGEAVGTAMGAQGALSGAEAGAGAAAGGFWNATPQGPAKYLGPVGLALGAYGMKEAFEDKNPVMGGISGLGAGAGLAGTLGLMGLATPFAPLALGGLVLGALGGGLGYKSHKYKREQDAWKRLYEENPGLVGMTPEPLELGAGRSKGELIRQDLDPNFIGMADDGAWVNNSFAESRNVADLRPEDIWGYSAFTEKFGPKYWHAGEEARRALAQEALTRGLITESTGQIKIGADADYDAWGQKQIEEAMSGG